MERQQAATLRAKEALAAEEQKCQELQAQLDAQSPTMDREALEKEKQTLAVEKQAMSEEKHALAKEKHALTERDAALRAAMKEFDAKKEALAAREAAMEEKERREASEELKNVAVEVKQFSMTATIRRQIDEQHAVLTKLFRVFEDVDVEDCKFKITHVARNLLALEGITGQQPAMDFSVTLRRRLSKLLNIPDKRMTNASFNNILTAAVGCAAIPTFNGYLGYLRCMGIATDAIATAAFGQHAREIAGRKQVIFDAIREIPHVSIKRRQQEFCSHILTNGISQCPNKALKTSHYCSRHTTKRQKNK